MVSNKSILTKLAIGVALLAVPALLALSAGADLSPPPSLPPPQALSSPEPMVLQPQTVAALQELESIFIRLFVCSFIGGLAYQCCRLRGLPDMPFVAWGLRSLRTAVLVAGFVAGVGVWALIVGTL